MLRQRQYYSYMFDFSYCKTQCKHETKHCKYRSVDYYWHNWFGTIILSFVKFTEFWLSISACMGKKSQNFQPQPSFKPNQISLMSH